MTIAKRFYQSLNLRYTGVYSNQTLHKMKNFHSIKRKSYINLHVCIPQEISKSKKRHNFTKTRFCYLNLHCAEGLRIPLRIINCEIESNGFQ